MNVQSLVEAMLPGVITAILTSIITVRLSLRSFHSQKWWEKKTDAYTNIFEHLSRMLYTLGQWITDATEYRHLSETESRKLSDYYNRAEEEIVRAAALGDLMIASDARATLDQLVKNLEDAQAKASLQGDFVGATDDSYGAVKEALQRLRVIAKRDLGVV